MFKCCAANSIGIGIDAIEALARNGAGTGLRFDASILLNGTHTHTHNGTAHNMHVRLLHSVDALARIMIMMIIKMIIMIQLSAA